MNAERLHAIALALREEMRSWTVTAKMQSMVEALRAVVQSSNASTQQNLASSLTALYATITDTASDKFSPAWRQILSEIGGEDLFGWRLKERIENILAQNQITPAVALQE